MRLEQGSSSGPMRSEISPAAWTAPSVGISMDREETTPCSHATQQHALERPAVHARFYSHPRRCSDTGRNPIAPNYQPQKETSAHAARNRRKRRSSSPIPKAERRSGGGPYTGELFARIALHSSGVQRRSKRMSGVGKRLSTQIILSPGLGAKGMPYISKMDGA